jgi:hypothetical protein
MLDRASKYAGLYVFVVVKIRYAHRKRGIHYSEALMQNFVKRSLRSSTN